MDPLFLGLLSAAYFSGSVSTAVIVCKILTLPDPRIVGSHNPGATNVLRIGGRKAAILTLLGDIAKTALPIYVAILFGFSQDLLIWVGVCALLGHCFPIYYRFRGGKGVASLFAILTLVAPRLAMLAIVSWLIIAWSFRRSSVASITVAILVPAFAYQFEPNYFLALASLSAVIVLRHKTNIANMLKGKEPIIGISKSTKER